MSSKVTLDIPTGCRIAAPVAPEWTGILSREAIDFVNGLTRRFAPEVRELLAARERRQARIDAGELPDFLPETRQVREGCRGISSIVASRLPAPPIARWSSTR